VHLLPLHATLPFHRVHPLLLHPFLIRIRHGDSEAEIDTVDVDDVTNPNLNRPRKRRCGVLLRSNEAINIV
jgi:hypothetical protein